MESRWAPRIKRSQKLSYQTVLLYNSYAGYLVTAL
jgi:hypothetical protein